jgi:ketosteroid isomerase-like protein
MSTRDLVQRYYDSLDRKDDAWRELYSDDAVFMDASQTLNANGKAAVIQSFIPFLKGVDKVKIKQMIVEGEEACAIVRYDYINPKGAKMNQDVAEVWKVKDGKFSRLVIYFDLIAYRNFMRG